MFSQLFPVGLFPAATVDGRARLANGLHLPRLPSHHRRRRSGLPS